MEVVSTFDHPELCTLGESKLIEEVFKDKTLKKVFKYNSLNNLFGQWVGNWSEPSGKYLIIF